LKSDRDIDFDAVIARCEPKEDGMVPVPSRMLASIKRAAAVLQGAENPVMGMTWEGTRLNLKAGSAVGDISDSLTLKQEHPTITHNMAPELIEPALAHVDQMFAAEGGLLLRSKTFTYLAAWSA
jgi:hypothetical protein